MGSVVRDRKKGHSCPAHRERERGGEKWATVAWRSPGLGLGIYNLSLIGDNVCYTRGTNKE